MSKSSLLEEVLKLYDFKNMSDEDKKKIEEHIINLEEKFSKIYKLQSTVLNDNAKTKNFADLLINYMENKNGQRKA